MEVEGEGSVLLGQGRGAQISQLGHRRVREVGNPELRVSSEHILRKSHGHCGLWDTDWCLEVTTCASSCQVSPVEVPESLQLISADLSLGYSRTFFGRWETAAAESPAFSAG